MVVIQPDLQQSSVLAEEVVRHDLQAVVTEPDPFQPFHHAQRLGCNTFDLVAAQVQVAKTQQLCEVFVLDRRQAVVRQRKRQKTSVALKRVFAERRNVVVAQRKEPETTAVSEGDQFNFLRVKTECSH